MKCKSWFSHLALALTLGAGFCCATQAQSFPSRVITIVVPFAPGGPTDLSVRLIGKALATRLKQPVIIENKPGAGSTVGAGMVAHATADGYTLLWASTSSLGVAPALYPKLTFSPLTSFAPIGMVARSPLILVGRGNTPVHSLTGFIAAAHTGKLAYGSAGSGSVTHLVGEWFKDEARIDLLHVPYKGGAMALNDLLAGQVDLTFETISTVQPFLKSGRVQILATTGRARAPQFPNVPTVAEILRDDFEAYSWVGLVAPAGTPKAAVAVLVDALHASMADPAVQQALDDIGLDAVTDTPETFRQAIATDHAKWTALIRKIKPAVD